MVASEAVNVINEHIPLVEIDEIGDSKGKTEDAAAIQHLCLEKMRRGGMTPLQRCDLSDVFEDTRPSGDLVKEFYDLWAPDYEDDMAYVGYKNPSDVSQLLSQLIPAEDRSQYEVLDVGAGTGLNGTKLLEAGFSVIDATDASPVMLEKAKTIGVYRTVLPYEVLVAGETMQTVQPETYDIITSAGSFFPKYLEGPHLKCFLDCAKTGGWIVISACPHNDIGLGLRPVIKELEDDGIIQVIKEVYVPTWYRDEDGTVWAMKKLKRLK